MTLLATARLSNAVASVSGSIPCSRLTSAAAACSTPGLLLVGCDLSVKGQQGCRAPVTQHYRARTQL